MASLRWHQGPVARESTAAVFFGGITVLMLATPDTASAVEMMYPSKLVGETHRLNRHYDSIDIVIRTKSTLTRRRDE